MKEKTTISTLLNQHAGTVKIIVTILITIITTVWGVAMYYSKMEGKKAADSATVVETHVVVMEVKHQIDSMMLWMHDFDGQLEAVNENTVLIGNYVEGVNRAFDRHLQRSPEVTKADYADMMLLIDELKKKDKWTPLSPSSN